MCSSDYGVPQTRKRVVFVGRKKGSFEYPVISKDIVTCSFRGSSNFLEPDNDIP